MPLLESVALSWLSFERSTDCFENVVWRQPSLKSHTIDNKLWIQASSQSLPVLRSELEHVVIVLRLVSPVESFIHALLDDIGLDRHVFHDSVAFHFVWPIIEDLVRSLHVLEEHGLWGHKLELLLFCKVVLVIVHVESALFPTLDLAVQAVLSQVLHNKLDAVFLEPAVVPHGAILAVGDAILLLHGVGAVGAGPGDESWLPSDDVGESLNVLGDVPDEV